MQQALKLNADVTQYEFLKHGVCGDIKFLDDVKDFAVMEKSMNDCGLDPKEKSDVFRVTAAVLHIGNISFDEDPSSNMAVVAASAADTIAHIAKILGLEKDAIESALCFTEITIAGETSKKGKSPEMARYGQRALAKALYSKLFDWIVGRSNKCFPYPKDKSVNYIGVLDIAGFEYFQINSFEQFTINFCNEKLQQFFNERVLKDEQELYVKESIKFKEVEYIDNQDVIDMIEAKPGGILDILDDESKLPKSSDASFTDKVHKAFAKHFRLQSPRKSKMAYYKKMLDNEGFVIRHFAGAVCYTTKDFMDKNNDALTHDLFELMQTSKDPFTKTLFEPKQGEPIPKKGKLTLISLGAKFKNALQELMDKLHSTRASFVRCIKPNQSFTPKEFNGGEILSQLQCAGMVTVMDLMQGGFPSRTSFQDLYIMYKASLPPELASLEPRIFAKALFKALGLNEDDFQFGVSRVFFRPGKFAEFDQIMKSDPENLVKMVAKVQEWLIKQRIKRVAWATVAALKFNSKIAARGEAAITMQKVVKMFFARRTHAARARGLSGLKVLEGQVKSMYETVEKLPKNKDKYKAAVDGVIEKLTGAIKSVQDNEDMQPEDIKKLQSDMNAMIEKQLAAIKKEQEKQKLAEEAARLKKIAEEMEAARKAKEAEEAARKAQLAEMEERKKMEAEQKRLDEEAAAREEKARIKAEKEAEKQKKAAEAEKAAAAEEAAILAQERRDQELAMRLAMDHAKAAGDTGHHVLSDEARAQAESGQARRKKAKAANYEFGNTKQAALHKKHDLSKWKYADLRDTINTSCDVDLLEACREEFHRRLKVYHAWKSRNAQTEKEKAKRAPTALHSAAESRSAAPAPKKKEKKPARPQRYFRIPFTRPEDKKKGAKKGWWFAHFDGQWIARQMELHPEKPPVLLMAGKDDMEMCELSLDETGLARKRGAEILPREFETEWKQCGGQPYKKGGN
jgi:myosin-6